MASFAKIFEEYHLVASLVHGELDDQESIDLVKRIGKLPGFQPSMTHLSDCRFITNNLMTPTGVIQVSEVTPFAKSANRVYVVNDEMAKIFSVIYSSTSGASDNFYVTYDFNEACRRLGIPEAIILESDLYKTIA